MHHSSHPSVQGACCLDIGFRHMFSALDCVSFGWCICRAVRPQSYAYTDDSPGPGSLVGRKFAQSLGARLLVSVLHSMGVTYFTHNIIMYFHIDLLFQL